MHFLKDFILDFIKDFTQEFSIGFSNAFYRGEAELFIFLIHEKITVNLTFFTLRYQKYPTSKNGVGMALSLLYRELWPLQCFFHFMIFSTIFGLKPPVFVTKIPNSFKMPSIYAQIPLKVSLIKFLLVGESKVVNSSSFRLLSGHIAIFGSKPPVLWDRGFWAENSEIVQNALYLRSNPLKSVFNQILTGWGVKSC